MVWARNEFFDSRACNKTKVKLGSMYRRGKAGGTPKTTEPTYYDGTIPFLSISDMTLQGKYITKTSNHISEFGLSASAAWIVPPNSLIVSMYASVGLSAINRIPLATSQAMYSMVFDGELTVEYVYQFLCYFRTKKLPALLETGTQSNINADDIRNIQVPEIDTQSRLFVNKMSSFEQLAEVEKSALIYLFELKQYLLLNLFA